MKSIACVNNWGGVGTTSVVYHLAWMYADLGLNVVAADLDPQANLTSMFLDEDRLAEIWLESEPTQSVLGAIQPLLRGIGDVGEPHIEDVEGSVGLLVGDLSLSSFEDELNAQWLACLDGKERAFRVVSAFSRLLDRAADKRAADIVLIDVGPNLGALNRAVMIAADHVVIPLAPDLYSLQGLRNLGPTLGRWRDEWVERRKRNPSPEEVILPAGTMTPAGYVLLQHAVRFDRPVQAYARWFDQIPSVYRRSVLDEDGDGAPVIEWDPHCLALIKSYHTLMPMAMEARKPMFFLRPADGALGAHTWAVQRCYEDFRGLATEVAGRCGFSLPLSQRVS